MTEGLDLDFREAFGEPVTRRWFTVGDDDAREKSAQKEDENGELVRADAATSQRLGSMGG